APIGAALSALDQPAAVPPRAGSSAGNAEAQVRAALRAAAREHAAILPELKAERPWTLRPTPEFHRPLCVPPKPQIDARPTWPCACRGRMPINSYGPCHPRRYLLGEASPQRHMQSLVGRGGRVPA